MPVDMQPARAGTIVVSYTRAMTPLLVAVPYEPTALGTACTEQSATSSYRALAGNPTTPFVYAAAADFQGYAVACAAFTPGGSTTIGFAAPQQRMAIDAQVGVGFFTTDGPSNEDVRRFTIGSGGSPTLSGFSSTPAAGGAVALSAATSELFAASGNVLYRYSLGAQGALNTPNESVVTCAASDLVATADRVYAFCTDDAQIRRYAKTPFRIDGTAGMVGAADAAVSVGNNRAVVARIAPPGLAVAELSATTGMITDGPTLGSRVTAMAASADGNFVVTARQLDPTTSEIALWRVSGQTLTAAGTRSIPGLVTAVAFTAAL